MRDDGTSQALRGDATGTGFIPDPTIQGWTAAIGQIPGTLVWNAEIRIPLTLLGGASASNFGFHVSHNALPTPSDSFTRDHGDVTCPNTWAGASLAAPAILLPQARLDAYRVTQGMDYDESASVPYDKIAGKDTLVRAQLYSTGLAKRVTSAECLVRQISPTVGPTQTFPVTLPVYPYLYETRYYFINNLRNFDAWIPGSAMAAPGDYQFKLRVTLEGESGSQVTGNGHPETIHDFYGFPRELYEIQYPAPGDPDLARRVARLLGEPRTSLSTDWGLDHGSWSVLRHIWPAADWPVIQLSLNSCLSPAEHLALGRALAPLRREGVLVLGSGNIVHNLRHAMASQSGGDPSTPAWASAFDADVARAVEQHDTEFLVQALPSQNGRIAHPTPDHYLPLLYVAGAAE